MGRGRREGRDTPGSLVVTFPPIGERDTGRTPDGGDEGPNPVYSVGELGEESGLGSGTSSLRTRKRAERGQKGGGSRTRYTSANTSRLEVVVEVRVWLVQLSTK